jgi:hypothetical protein
MKTKHYLRFLNRANHLDADIELADAIAIAVKGGALSQTSGGPLFDSVVEDHTSYSARANIKLS